MSSQPLPLAADQASLRFAEFANQIDWRRLYDQHVDEIARCAQCRINANSGVLRGEPAGEYLGELINAVTQELLKRHGAYGSVRWLWYLRRLPDVLFAGDYMTTLGYDRALAESLSSFFRGSDKSTDSKLIAFRTDQSAFRHICRYVGGVKFLSHLHGLFRRAGKGATVDVQSRIPYATQDDVTANAIQTYDIRHDRSNKLARAGLGLGPALADAGAMWVEAKAHASALYLTFACTPIWVPVTGPDDRGGFRHMNVYARHALMTTTVESILRPFRFGQPIRAPYVQSIESILILLMMVPVLFAIVPWALSSVVQFGYFFIADNKLQRIMDEWLPSLREFLAALAPEIDWSHSYTEWHARLKAIQPSLWPLKYGGILRDQSIATLVDVTAASNALTHRLELDRADSDFANDRADAFELEVQDCVSRSAWHPNERLASLRGRQLRRGSQNITDIDAIGAIGDTLLLISCKSIIYDGDYDRGSYRVVRNAQSTVDCAVVAWQEFVAGLQANPVGDNFDFSSYGRIIGVVCTPFAVYSSDLRTLAFAVDDLRCCTSIVELQEWLDRA